MKQNNTTTKLFIEIFVTMATPQVTAEVFNTLKKTICKLGNIISFGSAGGFKTNKYQETIVII